MNWRFESGGFRKKWGRKYFPSIRFVALELMEMHGVEFAYTVPKARTYRKRKVLGWIWRDLLGK